MKHWTRALAILNFLAGYGNFTMQGGDPIIGIILIVAGIFWLTFSFSPECR